MAHAKSVIERTGSPERETRRHWRGEFFSLGGLLAPYATTRLALAPWAFSAAVLAVLASWDPIARGGEFDAILIGLSAYELLIGLTTDRPRPRPPSTECVSPDAPAA